MNSQKEYNIDRRTASRLLSVSLRTVDRYLADGKLSHAKKNGRVWLDKEEILLLLNAGRVDKVDTVSGVLWQHDKVDKTDTDNVDSVYFENLNNSEGVVIGSPNLETDKVDKTDTDNQVYKTLYTETKEELEQALLRVGRLESQIINMVPLLELQKQKKLLQESNDFYEKKIQDSENMNQDLLTKIKENESVLTAKEEELKSERLNKAVIATLLFMLLCLQPVLWFILK